MLLMIIIMMRVHKNFETVNNKDGCSGILRGETKKKKRICDQLCDIQVMGENYSTARKLKARNLLKRKKKRQKRQRQEQLSSEKFLYLILSTVSIAFLARQLSTAADTTRRLGVVEMMDDSPSYLRRNHAVSLEQYETPPPQPAFYPSLSQAKEIIKKVSAQFGVILSTDNRLAFDNSTSESQSQSIQQYSIEKPTQQLDDPQSQWTQQDSVKKSAQQVSIGTPAPSPSSVQDDKKISRMTKYKANYKYAEPNGNWQLPPECGHSPFFVDFFRLPQSQRSRYDEDRTIFRTFFQHQLVEMILTRNNTQGTYIELGGFDGKTESNSRFFDLCLNWKGLLIEGNPKSFRRMRRERPNAHRMSFAPSCSAEYEAVNKTVDFAMYNMANAGIKGFARTYDLKPMVAVPCGPLGPVLEDVFGDEHINFFSLDVEGAEAMVLQTIDFEKVNIDILMVEVSNNYCGDICESRDESRKIMDQAGYKRYEGVIRASDVHVRPGSEFANALRKFTPAN